MGVKINSFPGRALVPNGTFPEDFRPSWRFKSAVWALHVKLARPLRILDVETFLVTGTGRNISAPACYDQLEEVS